MMPPRANAEAIKAAGIFQRFYVSTGIGHEFLT